MSILKIRDEKGDIIDIPAIKGEKGDKGDAYTLTEADKNEISNMAKPDMNNYYTKEEINAILGDIESLLGGI